MTDRPDELATVERAEVLVPGPAEAFAALLGAPAAEDTLPLLWHWLYLLERPAQKDLGIDGHPLNGIPAPPGPGRRRMWAGGEVSRTGPLRIGHEATRWTSVESVTEKTGRSGSLVFVAVRHRIEQFGTVVVDERQDIVYRDTADQRPADAIDARALSGHRPEGGFVLPVDPTLLFRFSALTYNAHRIHYDLTYCRDVEHYPNLVVHGPLQAMVMAQAARAYWPDPANPVVFRYRLRAPLHMGQGLIVHASREPGRIVSTTISDFSGRQTATGDFQPLSS